MKRPAAFDLFASDWLGSASIRRMTPAEEGAYIRLLAEAWSAPEMDCGLPDNDEQLAVMSRLGSEWANGSGNRLKARFCTIENGRRYNDKLRAEWNKSVAYLKSRAKNLQSHA
jgi:uncharacterized protein YdaU (DUF1376 family)